MVGSAIPHYKILEKIGESGMGLVYLAKDPRSAAFMKKMKLPL